jgi:hypothetical protein
MTTRICRTRRDQTFGLAKRLCRARAVVRDVRPLSTGVCVTFVATQLGRGDDGYPEISGRVLEHGQRVWDTATQDWLWWHAPLGDLAYPYQED